MARTPYPAGVAADFQSVIGIILVSYILVSLVVWTTPAKAARWSSRKTRSARHPLNSRGDGLHDRALHRHKHRTRGTGHRRGLAA
jgi:hypothetical protein